MPRRPTEPFRRISAVLVAAALALVLAPGEPEAGDAQSGTERWRQDRVGAMERRGHALESKLERRSNAIDRARSEHDRRLDAALEAHHAALSRAVARLEARAAAIWGRGGALLSDRHRVVDYGAEGRVRRVVDLREGQARVELALDPSEAADDVAVRKQLRQALTWAITAPADARSVIAMALDEGAPDVDAEPLLAGLVDGPDGRPIGRAGAVEFAERLLATPPSLRRVRGEDGDVRILVGAYFDLADDHLERRARRFAEIVFEQAERQKLPAPLLFAVIETESSYNPLARSPVPAFGLMQIVPGSAGRDAYQFLYGKDRLLSDEFLYDPSNNVVIGAAYLHKLYYRYLRAVEDDQARMWCTIAAYNTGLGNVVATFAGRYSQESHGTRSGWRALAAERINALGGEEVFAHLEAELPHVETRNYIARVRSRMPRYQAVARQQDAP